MRAGLARRAGMVRRGMHPVRRRLISIVSPWRLIPELDALDDGQCKLFLTYVRTAFRREGAAFLPLAVAALAVVPMGFALLIANRFGVFVFSDSGSITGAGWVALMASLVASVLLGARMRQVIDPRHVRYVARARLRRPRCGTCGVMLTDMVPDDCGLVTCPYCKRPYVDPACLRSIEQLAACDAWSPPRKPLAGPQPAGDRACKCGYPLRGLPIEGTTVTCPECGRQAQVRPDPE